MSYFLKKSYTRKKGEYLQVYYSFYDPKKGPRNISHETVGYSCDLIARGIKDPIAYANDIVRKLNIENDNKDSSLVSEIPLTKHAGHFLLSNMFDYLDIDDDFNALCISKKLHYRPSDLIRSLSYAQIIAPGSKLKAFDKVIPSIYGATNFSYDQILDGINLFGNDYEKFIEVMNHCIEKKFGKRKTSSTFFDCTNYYFEIDLSSEDKQKGPSKENRHDPIIGQALLLDEEQIPIAMKMYPGNLSEKPLIRECIADIKQRYDIEGRIIQIADKGLNCAENIYSAVVESNDGYIFSRTFRGRGLSEVEKKWMLLDNESNVWTEYYDNKGKVILKIKECVDDFDYSFDLKDEDGKVIETIKFTVREKRVVTYSPSLAKKQIHEIQKDVEKLRKKLSYKEVLKEELGFASKYVNAHAFDKDGILVDIKTAIDEDKIKEAISYAGYNLLVTSEYKKSAYDIYKAYHGLWRIEESFRIMKNYLSARPVFVQVKETIYGHFLMCYLAFTVLRLVEIKLFKDQIPVGQLIDCIRDYKITECRDGSFINGTIKTPTLMEVKKILGIRKLANAYLSKKDVDLLFSLHLEDYFE